MNGDVLFWKYGLIFAAMCVLLGIAAVMSSRQAAQRRMASGLFLQGVMLIFVVGAAHFQPVVSTQPAKADHSSNEIRRGLFQGAVDLRLAGLAVAGLLLVQSGIGPGLSDDEQSEQDHSP